jgi:putative hydrolase of the HAD superfamily
MSTPRAVLFDLDDTLYAYAPCNEAALAAAHELLRESVDVSAEGFRSLHDDVRLELARELRGQAASHERALFFKRIVERLTGAPRAALAGRLLDRYWEVFLAHMRPAPGALEVLAQLAAERPLGLVSNHTTAAQLRKVARLELEPFFAVVVTSEEVGAEKPDARVFARALEALGAQPSEAVMVGDDPECDARGARAHGLAAILTTEFRADGQLEGLADAVVGSVTEVPPALEALASAGR